MKILLVNNETTYLPHLQSLLNKYGRVTVVAPKDDIPINNFDLVVLSGGHHTYITEHPEDYQKEIKLVKSSIKPILGVCLGAEIIAYAFGAKLAMLPDKQKGLIKVGVVNKNGIFKNMQDFIVYENHQIAIQTLSDELIGLAKTPSGFEVIKHITKPIYGFQFHPEVFQNISLGDEVFENTLNILTK